MSALLCELLFGNLSLKTAQLLIPNPDKTFTCFGKVRQEGGFTTLSRQGHSSRAVLRDPYWPLSIYSVLAYGSGCIGSIFNTIKCLTSNNVDSLIT